MLRSLKDLRGVALRALDGVIGKVDDFYFDDEGWGIRYLVVDTAIWLSGKRSADLTDSATRTGTPSAFGPS